jgi:hypothetical protein
LLIYAQINEDFFVMINIVVAEIRAQEQTLGDSRLPVVVVPLAVAAAALCFIFYSPWFRRYRKGMLHHILCYNINPTNLK